MKCQFGTLILLVILKIIWALDPQVYESNEDRSVTNKQAANSREEPESLIPVPTFDFKRARQQDPKKFRYLQQQRIDLLGILRKSAAWTKISQEQQVSSAPIEVRSDNAQKLETNRTKPLLVRRRKNRKLAESQSDNVDRQDYLTPGNPVVYIQPNQFKTADVDLSSLNALIGQNPNIQLQGLKQLLEHPQKDHTPIMEETEDIPNPQSKPNVQVAASEGNKLNLNDIQNQLDQLAQTQTQQVLAKAQEEAAKHVKAQYEALSQAQVQAQTEALAKIKAQNQGPGFSPLALAQVAPSYAPDHNHQALALLQAQKVLQSQIQEQDNTILKAHLHTPNVQISSPNFSKTKFVTSTHGGHPPIIAHGHKEYFLPTPATVPQVLHVKTEEINTQDHSNLHQSDSVSSPEIEPLLKRVKRGENNETDPDYYDYDNDSDSDYEYGYDSVTETNLSDDDILDSNSTEIIRPEALKFRRKRKRHRKRKRPVFHKNHNYGSHFHHNFHHSRPFYQKFKKPEPHFFHYIKEEAAPPHLFPHHIDTDEKPVYEHNTDHEDAFLEQKKQHGANVIVINNSNQNQGHKNEYPQHYGGHGGHHQHFSHVKVKHKHTVHSSRRPSIKKLKRISNKIDFVLAKVNKSHSSY